MVDTRRFLSPSPIRPATAIMGNPLDPRTQEMVTPDVSAFPLSVGVRLRSRHPTGAGEPPLSALAPTRNVVNPRRSTRANVSVTYTRSSPSLLTPESAANALVERVKSRSQHRTAAAAVAEPLLSTNKDSTSLLSPESAANAIVQLRHTIETPSASHASSSFSKLPSTIVITGTGLRPMTLRLSNRRALVTPGTHEKKTFPVSHAVTPRVQKKKSVSLQKKKAASAPFPETVHAMVTEAAMEHPDVIEWVDNGAAFRIDDSNKRLRNVLRKYFSHGNYSSLQRQLNMYGWKKSLSGEYDGAFHHPHFHRDRGTPEDLACIKRNVRPTKTPLKKTTKLQYKTAIAPSPGPTKKPATTSKKAPPPSRSAQQKAKSSNKASLRPRPKKNKKAPLPPRPAKKQKKIKDASPTAVSVRPTRARKATVTIATPQATVEPVSTSRTTRSSASSARNSSRQKSADDAAAMSLLLLSSPESSKSRASVCPNELGMLPTMIPPKRKSSALSEHEGPTSFDVVGDSFWQSQRDPSNVSAPSALRALSNGSSVGEQRSNPLARHDSPGVQEEAYDTHVLSLKETTPSEIGFVPLRMHCGQHSHSHGRDNLIQPSPIKLSPSVDPPTPVPMPALLRSSSSTFYAPFVGLTNALSFALDLPTDGLLD